MNTDGPSTPIKYTKDQLQGIIDNWSAVHNVDPKLLHSIVDVESNWKTDAVSPTGVVGLAQMTLPTSRDMISGGHTSAPELHAAGIDRRDPYKQLELAAANVKSLAKQFGNDPVKVFAGYNGGAGATKAYFDNNVPFPRQETSDYVVKTMKRYDPNAQAPMLASSEHTVPKREMAPSSVATGQVEPVVKPEVAKVDDTALKIAEANRDRSVAELERSRLNRPEIEKDKGDGLAKWVMDVPTLAVNTNYRPTKLGKKLNFGLQG